MMATATATIEVAKGYLGPPPVIENPSGSNRTIIGPKFAKIDGADAGDGVAWCAEFFSVCQIEAGDTEFRVSASCLTLIARYKDGTNGQWLGNPGTQGLLQGDEGFLGVNGGDHTFRVEYTKGDSVVCIDGNWGDKVTRVVRPVASIYGFGRPNYDSPKPVPIPVPTVTIQEDEMPTVAVRRVVVNPSNPGQGYILTSRGDAQSFGGAPPLDTGTYFDNGAAMDIVITDWAKLQGYVLDCRGALHPFGGLMKPTEGPYWENAFVPPLANT